MFRGTINTWALTKNDSKRPDQTGRTWKYYNSEEWKDAEEGLEVICADHSVSGQYTKTTTTKEVLATSSGMKVI